MAFITFKNKVWYNLFIFRGPSLVLVQPRKTRPSLSERLLMGRKESNQTNKSSEAARSSRIQGGFKGFA